VFRPFRYCIIHKRESILDHQVRESQLTEVAKKLARQEQTIAGGKFFDLVRTHMSCCQGTYLLALFISILVMINVHAVGATIAVLNCNVHALGATIAVLNRDRAYHGNAAEHREQKEVEGTHDSVAVCPIVRRETYEMRGRRTANVEGSTGKD
jgi:hypothetical protein